jgi:hypothetical protein
VNRLLVYFQGGGGCWNYETCAPGSTYFDDAVDEHDDPAWQQGVLDLENPENPFKDYYAVFIPSCTGDVYMGNRTTTYTDEQGDKVVIEHRGFANGSAALEWVYGNFSGPESIFVTGCSAGSIGSIMFAPYLIDHYPVARVSQLGDSEAFVFDEPVELQDDWAAHDNFASWIPALTEISPGDFTMEKFYTAIANFYPRYTFSQYNSAHDPVQVRYFDAVREIPTPGAWERALARSLETIHAGAANFRSYTGGGTTHCVTPRESFYTLQTNGVSFRDWVADIAEGNAVANVQCTRCDAP